MLRQLHGRDLHAQAEARGGRRDALAQAGDHAAGQENVFGTADLFLLK